jgi:hypothetical protein
MSASKEIERMAYLAGLFDGEGCISSSWGSKRFYYPKSDNKVIKHFPRLQFVITNKSNLLLEMVKAQVGFGNVYKGSGSRVAFDYRIGATEEMLSIINALIPYVKLKREPLNIAKEALTYQLKRGQRRWKKEEKLFFYENYMAKLEKLLPQGKKRGRPPKYTLNDRFS